MTRKGASFLLFLPSLPESATRKDVKQFVRDGLAESGYHGLALYSAVTSCTILCVTDPVSGKSECHGLVQIRPAKAAMQAIEALNGKELLGSKVEVRRYHQRSGLPSALASAAQKERRRRELKLDLVETSSNGAH
mgnify:FL=1